MTVAGLAARSHLEPGARLAVEERRATPTVADENGDGPDPGGEVLRPG